MPIYEYRCQQCHRKSSIFVRSIQQPSTATCEHCGGTDLVRLFSTFAVLRGSSKESDDLGGVDDGLDDLEGMDTEDPRQMARWMRRMQQETGEELGSEFEDAVTRMEAGEIPEDLGEGPDAGENGWGDEE